MGQILEKTVFEECFGYTFQKKICACHVSFLPCEAKGMQFPKLPCPLKNLFYSLPERILSCLLFKLFIYLLVYVSTRDVAGVSEIIKKLGVKK